MQNDSAALDFDKIDDDDDSEILMAAAAWVSGQNEDSDDDNDGVQVSKKSKKPKKSKKSKKGKGDDVGSTEKLKSISSASATDTVTTSPRLHSPPKVFSLHLTKVPYAASQGDIRFAFGEKGCNVTSVRLVYDRDQKTGERSFRGVAFVDVADAKSFERGLEFHNKSFLGKGRRVNVRPTRTKSELSEIVKRTEEKVANLIARSKESGQGQTTKRERDDDTPKNERKRDDGGPAKKRGNAQERGSDRNNNRNKKRKSSGHSANKKDSPTSDSKSKEDASKVKNGALANKPISEANGKHIGKKINDSPTNKQKTKDTTEATAKGKIEKTKHNHRKGVAGSNSGSSQPKLTKKERAKKAAIIRMKKYK